MASVRRLDPKDPKSPWVVEYTDAAGKRRRKTPKSGKKKDADAIRQEIEREMGDGVHVAPSQSCTVAFACDEYLKQNERRVADGRIGFGRSRSVKIAVLNSIVPFIGSKLWTELEASATERFYDHMMMRGLKPVTAKDRIGILLQIEAYAKKRGWVKELRLREGKADLRGIPAPVIETFTLPQIRTLLDKAGVRDHRLSDRATARAALMVNVAAFCGLRLGEILGLKGENVDFDRGVIRVRTSMTAEGLLKGPKTRAGVRDVPMPKHVRDMLQDWMARWYVQNEQQLVVTTKAAYRLRPTNFREEDWLPLLKRAGLWKEGAEQFHFHALRHFCASWMIEQGMSVMDVARLLGHSKFDMTLSTYAHPISSQERRHEVIEDMAAKVFMLPAPGAGATSAHP